MIGFIILLILLIAFYSGARRGTPLQLIYTIGCVIAYFVAAANYQGFAKKIDLYVPYMSVTEDSKLVFYDEVLALDLDKAYYAAIAFLLIAFMVWLVTKLFGIFASSLRFQRFRFLKGYDWLLSGILNVLTVYTIIFMLLMVLSMIPLATVQNIFEKSHFARFIVEKSPILSEHFTKLWITEVIR